MITAAILIALWLTLNLIHGIWVGSRRLLWEKHIHRAANGLLPDADAYRIGNGPIALLFIHGFADTPCIWRRITQHLAAKESFTCRAMCLPGSAEPAHFAKRQSLMRWRTGIADEIVRLHETHAHVWLVGHSMGGALALDAARRNPEMVDGVIALAPMIDVSRKRCPLLPARFWFRLARIALSLSPTFESCFSAEGAAVDDPTFTYTRDRFIPFPVYGGLFALIDANRNQAARFNRPLFLVTSGRDSVVDSSAALRWGKACKIPKEIREWPDVDHVIPLEIGWQKLFDDVAAFVLKHSSSPLNGDG